MHLKVSKLTKICQKELNLHQTNQTHKKFQFFDIVCLMKNEKNHAVNEYLQ